MYLGFAGSMAGMPLSLYFDIENYSDRPVDYQVEYLSPLSLIHIDVYKRQSQTVLQSVSLES